MDSVETERLLLRPFVKSDLDAMLPLHEQPEFWWYPLRRGQTRAETESFLQRRLDGYVQRGFDLWAVIDRAADRLIGWAGLSVPEFLPSILPAVEVGWRLDRDVWGRGYATEAGAAALQFGFTRLGLDRIVSICEPENVASARVMQKLGMDLVLETTHPRLGVALEVRALDAIGWRDQAKRS